jgi:hypothetical protein
LFAVKFSNVDDLIQNRIIAQISSVQKEQISRYQGLASLFGENKEVEKNEKLHATVNFIVSMIIYLLRSTN